MSYTRTAFCYLLMGLVCDWLLRPSGLLHCHMGRDSSKQITWNHWKVNMSTQTSKGQRNHGHTLQWRHNECNGVSNHQRHDCLLGRFFRHRSRKHQSSASLTFVRIIHRWPVNSLHKGLVTRNCFPFDDVIMIYGLYSMPVKALRN